MRPVGLPVLRALVTFFLPPVALGATGLRVLPVFEGTDFFFEVDFFLVAVFFLAAGFVLAAAFFLGAAFFLAAAFFLGAAFFFVAAFLVAAVFFLTAFFFVVFGLTLLFPPDVGSGRPPSRARHLTSTIRMVLQDL